MKRVEFRLVLLALLALALTANGLAQKGLEKLLKESKMDYTKMENGYYKIWVSYQGETSLVMANERTVGSDESDPKLKICYLYCLLLPARTEGEPPRAFYKKMAELNDQMSIGRVGINEGDGVSYYTSSFWLYSANAGILTQELAVAHFSRLSLKKILEGF
jgi:hypothetical protein